MSTGKRVAVALASTAAVAGGCYLGLTHLNDRPQQEGILGYVGFLLFLVGLCGLVWATDKGPL